MNQAGAARLLAVVVLVAQAPNTWPGTRPGADSASSPRWAGGRSRRGEGLGGGVHPHPVPARRPAQHRADGRGPTGAVRPLGRQLKGDGIEMVTLESTSSSAPSQARSGYSLRWASTSAGLPRWGIGRRHQQPWVL